MQITTQTALCEVLETLVLQRPLSEGTRAALADVTVHQYHSWLSEEAPRSIERTMTPWDADTWTLADIAGRRVKSQGQQLVKTYGLAPLPTMFADAPQTGKRPVPISDDRLEQVRANLFGERAPLSTQNATKIAEQMGLVAKDQPNLECVHDQLFG